MEQHVTLTGWLPKPEDVNIALNAADIGLVMRVGNRSDDFHMTGALVHNMACGLPLLAARFGGVSEVVQENNNGLMFQPNNMDEFKEKLIQLATNPELRKALGTQAEADAHRHFNMEHVVQQTIHPLLTLCRNGREASSLTHTCP